MRILLPILVIFISVIGWWLGFFSTDYSKSWSKGKEYYKDYSKPWFTGKQYYIVCARPYDSNSDCMTLLVHSDGEAITGFQFRNGEYLESYDGAECFQAASFYNFDQICQIWDEHSNSWDIMPAGSEVE